MVSIADFPVDAMTWGDPSDRGVFKLMQGSHPKGYIALQLPPATLAFDVEDPKSPRMKLRVTGDVIRSASTHRKSGCSPTTPTTRTTRSARSSPRSGGARPKGLC